MKIKFKKIIISVGIIIAVLISGFFGVRYYAYHKSERDVQSEKAAFSVSAKVIVSEFEKNEAEANKKYLEKPVAISGIITSINGNEVILDEIGVCHFENKVTSLKVGDKVNIKGRVVGYDDILGGINLDQCSLNKN